MPYDSATKAAPKRGTKGVALKVRPKPKPVAIPEPVDRWEGFLKGETGPAKHARFVIHCRLSFLAGRVIGSGASGDFPRDADDQGRQFTLNGQSASDQLNLALQFNGGNVSQSPFSLHGQIDAQERFIGGTWTWGCPGCVCGGATGRFELRRVQE
jgi:hypothetical protein